MLLKGEKREVLTRLLVARAVTTDVGADADGLNRDGRPRVDKVCELETDLGKLRLLDVLEAEL